MCQTSVFVEKNGNEELVLENVTHLVAIENGVKITSLFDGSKDFPGTEIRRIDFAAGKVYLGVLD